MSESWGTAVVTIPADDDGMVGCQCPLETCRPRYFKIEPSSPGAEAVGDEAPDAVVNAEPLVSLDLHEETATPPGEDRWGATSSGDLDEDGHTLDARDEAGADGGVVLHCPYCGQAADRQQFFTPEQREYAKSLILRHIIGALQKQFKRLERRPDPRAFLSIGITVQTSALPAIAVYEENRLKQRVRCPHCQAHYAVYGISFTCPRCGGATLLWHLDSTAQEIRAFLEMPDDLLSRLDPRSREKLVENALEDVVSFWEGYLKAVYRRAVRRRYAPDQAAQLERQIGTTFQRVPGATGRFAADLGIDLLADESPGEIELLARVFNKRHVLAHNLGLVDERFLAQTHSEQRVGQEIEVSREETLCALDSVSHVLRRADEEARASPS